jgi:transposase
MIRTAGVRIWLATAPLDMRRSFDALAEQVRAVLAGDPMSGHLFVFRNRGGERLKILWWDRSGYAIWASHCPRDAGTGSPIPVASAAWPNIIGAVRISKDCAGGAVPHTRPDTSTGN